MTHHPGNLVIYPGDTPDKYAHITSVGGDVSIRAVGNHLPNCKSVGGYASINAAGNHLPNCIGVWRGVYIYAPGNHLPNCTSVGGRPIAPADQCDALLEWIADIVLADPERLNMGSWHCGTSHCIAGWAQALAASDGVDGITVSNARALIDGNVLLGMKHSGLFFLDAPKALAKLKKFKAERERMGA